MPLLTTEVERARLLVKFGGNIQLFPSPLKMGSAKATPRPGYHKPELEAPGSLRQALNKPIILP